MGGTLSHLLPPLLPPRERQASLRAPTRKWRKWPVVNSSLPHAPHGGMSSGTADTLICTHTPQKAKRRPWKSLWKAQIRGQVKEQEWSPFLCPQLHANWAAAGRSPLSKATPPCAAQAQFSQGYPLFSVTWRGLGLEVPQIPLKSIFNSQQPRRALKPFPHPLCSTPPERSLGCAGLQEVLPEPSDPQNSCPPASDAKHRYAGTEQPPLRHPLYLWFC